MSRQEKRSRGKRTRDEPSMTSRGPAAPGAAPISYASSESSFYGEQSYSPVTSFPAPGRPSGPASFGQQGADHAPPPQAPVGKVAIPPLKSRQQSESSPKSKKGRTSHACDTCRKAKAGCSGGQPCSRCRNSKVACVYGDGKRDRDRKRLTQLSKDTSTLSQVNTDMVEALRRIRLDILLSPAEMRAQIDDILAMNSAIPSPDTRETSSQPSKGTSELGERNSGDDDEDEDDDDNDTDLGSNNSVDVTDIDADQANAMATGHMGKSSSVAWAKRTAQEVQQTSAHLGDATGFTLASYHVEDPDVEVVNTNNIDPLGWPVPQIAESLVLTYFNEVHGSLPLVNKVEFMSKFIAFDGNTRSASQEDIIWLGVSNMIFAISSVYLHVSKRLEATNPYDHLVYLERAKRICLNEDMLYRDARVSNTCALGLMCLYFMSTGNLNRAWTFNGLALRQAFSQGLHNRNISKSLTNAEKEYRIRLWWSLFSIECCLNQLTGRPSGISDREISTPLPVNMDEDAIGQQESLYDRMGNIQRSNTSRRGSRGTEGRSSATFRSGASGSQPLAYTFPILSLPVTKSTYFIYRAQLNILSHKIVTELYCASVVQEKWSEVQLVMQQIDERLLSWKSSLPSVFSLDFDPYSAPEWNNPRTLERLGLAMLFNSSRMILFRPCLCRFEDRKNSHRSARSKDSDQSAVEICLASARNIITLLSISTKNPNSHTTSASATIHAIPPFWLMLHYLCEALAVLMLEMAFQAPHIGVNEAAEILEDAKKGIRWLIDLSAQSVAARKAWEIFDGLIRLVAPMIRWSVYDLPTQAPIPPGYNWRRFNTNTQSTYAAPWQQTHLSINNTFLQGHTTSTLQPQPSFLPYPQSYGQQEMASNPLDHTTAVQRFSNIGGVHGHFDDPWMHMFAASDPSQVPTVIADTRMTGTGMGMGMEMGMGLEMETAMGINEGSGSGSAGGYEQNYPDPESYGQYPSEYSQAGFGGP